MKSPDQASSSPSTETDGRIEDVKVSCLIMSGTDDEAEDESASSSCRSREDGPPSVIETSSMSPSLLREESTLRDDDYDYSLNDASESSSSEEDSDEDADEEENSEGGVESLSTRKSESARRPSRVSVKRLSGTIGGDLANLSPRRKEESKESFLPILRGFLFVALLPACSYVLKEATFVAREFSISKGVELEEDVLVQLLVGMNATFGLAVCLGTLSLLLNPSRLDRIINPVNVL